PGHAGVRRPAPQLAVDEVGEAPEKQPDRADRGGDIAERQDRKMVLAAEQYPRGHAAEEAAMKRHAALPQLKDLGGMLDEEREIVEQHVAGAAAGDYADRDPQGQIPVFRRGVPRRTPSDAERPDGNGDGIEDRKGEGKEGHRAAAYDERLRR